MTGASATLTDPARGFRADQWARYCGRHQTAEMIETTARAKLLDKSTSNKWTHDSIPSQERCKTTLSKTQNENIMQQQQTSHSGGKNDIIVSSGLIKVFLRFPLKVSQSFPLWIFAKRETERWKES